MYSNFVAYCGLYCNLCERRIRIPEHAGQLLNSLMKAGYDENTPGLAEFWRVLNTLAEMPLDKCCGNGKCGSPRCAIRKCAQSKEVALCPECDEYPCEHIAALGQSEPTLIHDCLRLRDIGVDAWAGEQEERRLAGFCYADIRCQCRTIPEE